MSSYGITIFSFNVRSTRILVKGAGNWENPNLGMNRVILEMLRVLIFASLVKEPHARFSKIH